MNLEKNKTWVLRRNSHITMSVVLVSSKDHFPLSSEEQWILDSLELITDIHFIFTPKSAKVVEPSKFSELYQASYYSLTKDETGISGVLRAIEYDKEFYPKAHFGYFVLDLENIKDINTKSFESIITLIGQFKKSIFKIKRYSPEKLSEFYLKPEKWYQKISRDNAYTTHYVDGESMFINYNLFRNISDFLEDKPGYWDTFENINDFFGSIVARLGTSEFILNKKVNEINVSTAGE